MKKQLFRKMMMVGTALCCVGTAQSEEAIELKTSKEIPGSIFGTGTHFGHYSKYDEELPLVEKAGFKWLRDGENWQVFEREKGVYTVPAKADAWVDDAVARGINVLYCPGHVWPRLYPFENYEAYKEGLANFHAFLAKHYRGRVKVWQIINEPANFGIRQAYGGSWNAKEGMDTPWLRKYADLTIAVAKAIREVDPDVTIVAGSCVFPANHHFMDLLKEMGGIKLLDGLVIHPYNFRLPPEITPYGGKAIEERDGISAADEDNTYSSVIRRLKEKMKAVGMKNTDIYATEFGYTSYHRTSNSPDKGGQVFEGFSDATVGKYLSRFFMLHLANELKAAFHYEFADYSPKEFWLNRFGMVKHSADNYELKPAYHAIQRMASLFCDPVKLFKDGFAVTASPDRYLPSKNWKRIEPYMIWDGQEIQALNRVEKYLFKNADTGEVMLVLWNAIWPSGRKNLMSNVTLDTADYADFSGVDIMTGEGFKVNASVKDGKTVLKNVIIPDYPVVIRMTPKK